MKQGVKTDNKTKALAVSKLVSGKSFKSVAKEFNVTERTLYNWIKYTGIDFKKFKQERAGEVGRFKKVHPKDFYKVVQEAIKGVKYQELAKKYNVDHRTISRIVCNFGYYRKPRQTK